MPPVAWSERPPSRRATVIAASGLVTSLLLTALTVLPSNYAIASPGPAIDTLAGDSQGPFVDIKGAQTYDASGELRLTTVSFANASTNWFTSGQVIQAYFSPSRTVEPAENIFGTPEDRQQEQQASAQQWITSQESATVAALTQRGVTVPATLRVAGIVDGSKADGLLKEDDILIAADGAKLVTYQDLTDFLDAHHAGDEVTFTVLRGGKNVDETFDLMSFDDTDKARIGIYVDPTFDLPLSVNIDINNIGGPSAGMMFALAILDKLSEEDELNGAKVAGTGEIDVDGQVYPIGGIQHKMWGAKNAGAEYFLAPVENCPEVVGHIPPGLAVYSVDDLADAYDAIVAIGKHDTAGLPTCSAAKSE